MVDLDRIAQAMGSKYWAFTYWTPQDCPPTLMGALTASLPHLSPESWPARLEFGGIYINGQAVKQDTPLSSPCKIEYYEPKFPIENASDYFPPFSGEQVLYQDSDALVVYKPNRIPSMAARDQAAFNLKAQVEEYLGETIHMPSRLDMSTQGLVLISRSSRMNRYLQGAFERKEVQKFYMFESAGQVDWTTLVVDKPIGRTPHHPVLRTTVSSGGKKATTVMTKLGEAKTENQSPTSVFLAQPLTGRTHQIRVHAQSEGISVVGDNFYDGEPADSLHLVSYRIRIWQPFTASVLDISLPERFRPSWIGNLSPEITSILPESTQML